MNTLCSTGRMKMLSSERTIIVPDLGTDLEDVQYQVRKRVRANWHIVKKRTCSRAPLAPPESASGAETHSVSMASVTTVSESEVVGLGRARAPVDRSTSIFLVVVGIRLRNVGLRRNHWVKPWKRHKNSRKTMIAILCRIRSFPTCVLTCCCSTWAYEDVVL